MNCCFTKPISKPNIHLRTSRCSSQTFISEVSHWVRNRNEVCKKFPAKCTHLSEGRIEMKPLYTKSSTWPLPNSYIGEDIYCQMTKCYVQGIETSAGISTDRTKRRLLYDWLFDFVVFSLLTARRWVNKDGYQSEVLLRSFVQDGM